MMTKLINQRYVFAALILSALLSSTLQAHLLPAQRGTLNFVDDGAYMALSLPISAFDRVDDDKNGLVSMLEFNKHRAEIISRIQAGVVLSEKGDERLLQGIMLSPVPVDEHTTSLDPPISRIYVMGKFVLQSPNSILRFRNDLYGHQSAERTVKISATRKSVGQKQTFKLTPNVSSMTLFGAKK